MKQGFDPRILSREDYNLAVGILGSDQRLHNPDLIISPDGQPYLYRWHIIKRREECSVYFHIQVRSDPERPLHDHPWDNMSVVLAGGYDEVYNPYPGSHQHKDRTRSIRKGDVIARAATDAHRLILPPEFKYTMTMFSTGPKRRVWGFWYPDGFRPFHTKVKIVDNVSIKENHQ